MCGWISIDNQCPENWVTIDVWQTNYHPHTGVKLASKKVINCYWDPSGPGFRNSERKFISGITHWRRDTGPDGEFIC